jgi:aminopeptidase-like protein
VSVPEAAASPEVGAPPGIGDEAWRLVERLYPIPRSITGDGVRQTLAILTEYVPLEVHEVPTGTPVLDWTVPREWNVREAWIADAVGRRVVDFADHNLHLMVYSTPFRGRVPLAELRAHLHSLPEQPDAIPYRTSYYHERWGFCLSHRDLEALPDGDYDVCVDTTLTDGHLTYGELLLPGETDDEVLLSAHVCHPSLANDNQSSIALATLLARELGSRRTRLSYRFLFVPGLIGAVTWLARNEDRLGRIRAGLVLAGTGDAGHMSYKRSRRGDTTIDRAVEHVLAQSGATYETEDFSPWGYDERQYCSPGFNLPVGCLMRTPHGQYPEYHTSADDMDFVRPGALAETFGALLEIVAVLEGEGRYRNLSPKGEPQLGRRGLYGSLGGGDAKELELAMLWVLNASDGTASLLDVAERSGQRFHVIRRAADLLLRHRLLDEIEPS